MTTHTLISRSNAPTLLRTPFSNITNVEYPTASTTPHSASSQPPLGKPESISAGLQETYEHSNPFNISSESFYSPRITHGLLPSSADLENFSIYRKTSPHEVSAPCQNHKRTPSVSFSPWTNDMPFPEMLFGGQAEEGEEGLGHQLLLDERFQWDSVTPPVTPIVPKDLSLEVGIFVTPPTPPRSSSLRISHNENTRTSTAWLSDDDWNMSGDFEDHTDGFELQDAYCEISVPKKAEVVWWK